MSGMTGGAAASPVEGGSRLRVERAQLAHHPGKLFPIDAAGFLQRVEAPCRQKVEIVQQPGHGRAVAAPVAQLQRQAFGERPGEQARRLELLQAQQHALRVLRQCAQAAGETGEIGGEPAGSVEGVYDRPAHQPVPGIGDIEHQLSLQAVAQAGRGGHALFRAGRLAVETGGAAGGGCEPFRHAEPVFGGFGPEVRLVPCVGRSLLAVRFAARQQRVFLKLGVDERLQFEAAHLQQPDRLLQSGRHRQPAGPVAAIPFRGIDGTQVSLSHSVAATSVRAPLSSCSGQPLPSSRLHGRAL